MTNVHSGDGINIHYDVLGRGEPVLLLHGGMTSCEFWRQAGYVDAFAGAYQLVPMDLRGHGASGRPYDQKMYSLPNDVADALAVIDAVGLDAVSIVGWSWGGTTALALAALHPDRVKAVVAIGSSGLQGRFSDMPADLAPYAETAIRIERDDLQWIAGQMERLGGRPWLRKMVLANDPQAMLAWCRGKLLPAPLQCALGDVRSPVIFMPGEHELSFLKFPDPVLPRHARLRPVPGANHISAALHVEGVVSSLGELMAPTMAITDPPAAGIGPVRVHRRLPPPHGPVSRMSDTSAPPGV